MGGAANLLSSPATPIDFGAEKAPSPSLRAKRLVEEILRSWQQQQRETRRVGISALDIRGYMATELYRLRTLLIFANTANVGGVAVLPY